MQPKLIYLARRHPRLPAAEFTARWRRHGALGMSLPRWRNIARYVHCDVLSAAADTSGLADGWDGVGLIWHHSPEARAAHLADASSREVMERDESATFARPIVEDCLVARELVLLTPPPCPPAAAATVGTGVAKLIRFLHSRGPVQDTSIATRLVADAAALRSRLASAASPAVGHVLNDPLAPEREQGWGLSCDAVEEFWFADPAIALRAAAILPASGINGAAATVVLTNEVLLHEA